MVVDTMTWQEVFDELVSDYNESQIDKRSLNIIDINKHKYVKAIYAAKSRVKFKPFTIKSKRNNIFYIIPNCDGKTEYKRRGIRHFVIVPIHYCRHYWIGVMGNLSDGRDICSFFANHLFCRYDERFLNQQEITDDYIGFVADFLQRNFSASMESRRNKETGKNEIFSLFGDGVVLGEEINRCLFVYKTYIRYDMLFDDQKKIRDELEEGLRKQMEKDTEKIPRIIMESNTKFYNRKY